MNNEFGITNDPQIEELLREISSILALYGLTIKQVYKGETSSLYQINRLKIKTIKN